MLLFSRQMASDLCRSQIAEPSASKTRPPPHKVRFHCWLRIVFAFSSSLLHFFPPFLSRFPFSPLSVTPPGAPPPRGSSITVEPLPSKTGDVFWRHLFLRVAYLQDERQTLLEPNSSRLTRARFHPVSRQPAHTCGVRKRLPFSLRIRPEVAPPS